MAVIYTDLSAPYSTEPDCHLISLGTLAQKPSSATDQPAYTSDL